MKKKLLTSIAIILLATLTACGGSSEDTKNSGKFDQYRAGDFIEIIESGIYYIYYTSYILGSEASACMPSKAKWEKYGRQWSSMNFKRCPGGPDQTTNRI